MTLIAETPIEGTKSATRGAVSVPRLAIAVPAALIAVAIPALGSSGLMLGWAYLAATVAVAAWIAPSRQGQQTVTFGLSLPLAFLLLVAYFVAIGTVASFANVPLWAGRVGGLLTWCGAMLFVVAGSYYRRGRIAFTGRDWPPITALLVTWAIGILVAATVPVEIMVRNVGGGTDFNRHLILMRQVADEGVLTYSQEEYPRGIHAALAPLWSATGVTRYLAGWLALESFLWLILALLVTACVVAVVRVGPVIGLPRVLTGVLAPLLAMLVLLQSMWVTAMVSGGFLTSVAAGLVLATSMAAMLSLRADRPRGLVVGYLVAVLSVLILAQTWTLVLPVLAPTVLLLAVAIWRTRRSIGPREWTSMVMASAVVGGLTAIPLLSLVSARGADDELVSDFAAFGDSGLTAPTWWWWVGSALAILAAFAYWRHGRRLAVLGWLLMAGSGAAIVVALLWITDARSEGLSYYPLKTMWTCSVLVVPMAVVGLLWLVVVPLRIAAGLKSRVMRVVVVSAVAAAAVAGIAGTAGWMVGYPSEAWLGARHGLAQVPMQVPVITALEDAGVEPTGADQGVVVWGVSPYVGLASISMTAGYPDWLTREATTWLGFDGIPGDAIPAVLLNRDAASICEYLRDYPNALRVTGPNPESGIPWLIDSGCPEDVIKPDLWLRAPIGDEWFCDLRIYQAPHQMPTWQEYQDYREGLGLEPS